MTCQQDRACYHSHDHACYHSHDLLARPLRRLSHTEYIQDGTCRTMVAVGMESTHDGMSRTAVAVPCMMSKQRTFLSRVRATVWWLHQCSQIVQKELYDTMAWRPSLLAPWPTTKRPAEWLRQRSYNIHKESSDSMAWRRRCRHPAPAPWPTATRPG
jgi:hypothetical protein